MNPTTCTCTVLPRWSGDTNFMTAVAETRVLPDAAAGELGQAARRLARLTRRLGRGRGAPLPFDPVADTEPPAADDAAETVLEPVADAEVTVDAR